MLINYVKNIYLPILLVVFYLFSNASCPPILNEIEQDFITSSSKVQRIIFLYSLGIGLSQLFYGRISEYIGKRFSLLLGLSIFFISSIGLLICSNIDFFLFCRFMQGFGAGCCSVISRMILVENFKEEDYIHATATIMFSSVLTEILSPLVCGIITFSFNWKSIFYLIIFFNVICIFVVIKFSKLLLIRREEQPSNLLINIRNALSNKDFLIYIFASSLLLYCITLYNASSPFIVQKPLGLSNFEFSLIFIIVDSPFAVVCYQIHSYKKSSKHILKLGSLCIYLGSISMFCSSFFDPSLLILGNIFSMSIFNIGTGYLFTYYSAKTMLVSRASIGTSSALVGSIQMICCAILSNLTVSFIKIEQLKVGIIFLCVSIIIYYIKRKITLS